jgi:hypothetical protein
MPYNSSTTLPNSPDVKIFLTGQLILEPDSAGRQCRVGINRSALNHQFSMEVRQKMIDNSIPDIIVWRHIGQLMPGGVAIGKEPSSNDVRKFVPTTSFLRNDRQDDRDFRWIVDLAGYEFHDGKVTINEHGTQPNIQILDGIFYTALRTDPEKLTVERTAENMDNFDLYSIASLIGVNIYLDTGEQFKLGYSDPEGEGRKELKLDKPSPASGVKSYEIWINNNPVDVLPTDPSTLHELKEYYKVVDTVTVHDEETENFVHYELSFTEIDKTEPDPAPPSFGTPTIPCMPVGSGK